MEYGAPGPSLSQDVLGRLLCTRSVVAGGGRASRYERSRNPYRHKNAADRDMSHRLSVLRQGQAPSAGLGPGYFVGLRLTGGRPGP